MGDPSFPISFLLQFLALHCFALNEEKCERCSPTESTSDLCVEFKDRV